MDTSNRRKHAMSDMARIAALMLVVACGAAQADTLRYHAVLNGNSEVPANSATGTGDAKATLDTATKVFKFTVSYTGLTGPATAAHFHGPAGPGVNGPPVVTLTHDSPWPADLIKGTATLTAAQIADLNAGKWYVNVHTEAHPSGEIRGQVMSVP